jgi:hypothetical protein
MIWAIYFVLSMQQNTTLSLTLYVTSAFAEHSLTPTATIFSSIIGAVLQLIMAKSSTSGVAPRKTSFPSPLLLRHPCDGCL